MSGAASTATQTGTAPPPSPREASPEDARLLLVVRTLIAFGHEFIASLRGRNQTTPPLEVARQFRTIDLALIINRITRGLMIAQALQARLLRRQARAAAIPAQPAAPARPASAPRPDSAPFDPEPPNPAPRRPRRTEAEDEDEAELLSGLPSAREIARRFRRRPVGAVIVEICRDLGITTQHKLWRDIQRAIIFHGGSMVRLLKHWMRNFRLKEEVAELVIAAQAGTPMPRATPPP